MRRVLVAAIALLLAGCSDAPADVEDPLDADGPDAVQAGDVAEPVLVEVTTEAPFSWSGRTKEGAFVCGDPQGTSSCPAGQQVQPDGAHTTTVPYDDNLTAAGLALDWTPADASQTGLVLAVYGPNGTLLATGEGTSAFTMDLGPASLAGLPADSALTLVVWPSAKAQNSPSVFADATRQPFAVSGTLVTTDFEWQQPPDAAP